MEKDTIIPTKNGCVRLSSKHGKNEKKANVAIATYLANKYGYDIDLLPDIQNEVSADTLNRTLCKLQEYKDNLTASRNAVDLQLNAPLYLCAFQTSGWTNSLHVVASV